MSNSKQQNKKEYFEELRSIAEQNKIKEQLNYLIPGLQHCTTEVQANNLILKELLRLRQEADNG